MVVDNIRINFDVVTSALDNANTRLADMGRAVAGIGKGLTASLTAPIAGLATFGVAYNSTMEDLQTSFEVMLGSQEKAVKMTKDLIDMGAKTPFESSQLAEYTKTLLAFGVSEEKVLPLMGKLGDVSLGNAEKMKSLTMTMGQISAMGKLQGGDLNQLIGQGWNPLNEIMKKTGESTEKIRERMSKGKISYKEVEDALVSATSAGGQFYQGMEKGSKTFSGQLSTLKDTASAALGEFTKPIFDKLKDMIPKVSKFIGDMSAKWATLSPEIKKIIFIVAGVVAAIGPLLIIIGTLMPIISTAISIFPVLGAAIGGVALPVVAIIAVIGALVAAVIYLWKNNEEFRTKVTNIWTSIQTIATGIFNALKAFWEEWGSSIVAFFTMIWDNVKIVVDGAFGIIEGLLDIFIGIFTGNWEKVWEGAKKIVMNIWDTITGVIKKGYNFVTGIWDKLTGKKSASVEVETTNKTAVDYTPIPKYAIGTNFATGGLSLVGENGPELVNLPRGSKVFTNQKTKSMVSNLAPTTGGLQDININGTIRLETDKGSWNMSRTEVEKIVRESIINNMNRRY